MTFYCQHTGKILIFLYLFCSWEILLLNSLITISAVFKCMISSWFSISGLQSMSTIVQSLRLSLEESTVLAGSLLSLWMNSINPFGYHMGYLHQWHWMQLKFKFGSGIVDLPEKWLHLAEYWDKNTLCVQTVLPMYHFNVVLIFKCSNRSYNF